MAYGLGVGAVPYTMLGELFTPKVVHPKKPRQIFINKIFSAACIRIVYSSGYFMLNNLMCEEAKDNIMTCNSYSGGQEHHSVWTSEIDSNYGN